MRIPDTGCHFKNPCWTSIFDSLKAVISLQFGFPPILTPLLDDVYDTIWKGKKKLMVQMVFKIPVFARTFLILHPWSVSKIPYQPNSERSYLVSFKNLRFSVAKWEIPKLNKIYCWLNFPFRTTPSNLCCLSCPSVQILQIINKKRS